MTRKTLLTSICTMALALCALPSWAITTQEIADMGRADVSDDLIITMIQASDVVPTLNPQDVISLKSAGVGDSVIHVLLNTREERQDAFEYDQAIRRTMLLNFQFPAGYFDNTYSGIHRGVGGSLTPIQPLPHPAYGAGYGAGYGGAPAGGMYGYGYYPDYVRTGPNGTEFNYNYGSNPGVLYDKLKWDDLWTLNYALYGVPPANRLYFRN